MKILFLFFNGGGLSSEQWLVHPYIANKTTDIVKRIKKLGEVVYLFDPIFYLTKDVVDKFLVSDREQIFKIEDVDLVNHCKSLYDRIKNKADRFFLISHSRGYIFAHVFINLYHEKIIGYINFDGGYTNRWCEKFIDKNKSDKSFDVDSINDDLISKISREIRSDNKQSLQLLSKIGKYLTYVQYKKTKIDFSVLKKKHFTMLIINNIDNNNEINLDMDDYVHDTLKDKIEFNEQYTLNVLSKDIVRSLYFVNRTHFIYFGLEDEIMLQIKYMLEAVKSKNKTNIYLIRHGETELNRLDIGQGSEIDEPLNELGKQQAKMTGKYIKKYAIGKSIVYSSSMKRAAETAEIITKSIDLAMPVNTDENLMEIGMGKLAGLKLDDPLKLDVEDAVKLFLNTYPDPIERASIGLAGFNDFVENLLKEYDIGVESVNSVNKRIARVIKLIVDLADDEYDNIFIVSHGHFLSRLIQTMMHIPSYKEGSMKYGRNCWIAYIKYEDEIFKLITNPNTEHLNVEDNIINKN